MSDASSTAIRPTHVEIDLDALRANARLMHELAGSELYAVVKADAYGHGAAPVARALAGQPGVRGFAVNLIEEAVELREAGIDAPILVMGPTLRGGYRDIVGHDLEVMVSSFDDLAALRRAAQSSRRPVSVHLMIDTGMGRLGFLPDQLPELAERDWAGLSLDGLCTHLACAETDDPDDPSCLTRQQLARYEQAVATAIALGLVRVPILHLANSAAALRFPACRRDLARIGLALYGNGAQPPRGQLRQVMCVRTGIAQLRTLQPGDPVSYGALFRARRPTTVAVLPLGYADGVPRRLTGRAEVLIHGQRCPTIGAITMGMIMVDVTDLSRPARVGDPVVALGRQGDGCITTAEFAEWADCIEYEVTCGMGKRVPRVYKGGA